MIPGQPSGHIDIAYTSSVAAEPRSALPPERVCDDDPLQPSSSAGLPESDHPDGADVLLQYSGSYPGMGRGPPVSVVYREHAGVDYVARMRDWITMCKARQAQVPQICVDKGVRADITLVEVVEGESTIGFHRFDPQEFGGSHGTDRSCGATARVGRTVRVADLVIQTEMQVDTTRGPIDWEAAVRPLDAQVAEVIKALRPG